MSEPTPRSQPPDKPAWLQRSKPNMVEAQGDSLISSSPDSPPPKRSISPTGKKRPAKVAVISEPRPPMPFSVRTLRFLMGGSVEIGSIPLDLGAGDLLKLWWKSNRTGFLTSVGLHGFLLFVFALWALPQVIRPNNVVLDGFSTVGPPGTADTEGPIQINAKITPVDLPAGRGKSTSSGDSSEKATENVSEGSAGGTAKPVGVEGAFVGRGSGGGGPGGGGGGKAGIWQGLGVGTKAPSGIAAGLAWLKERQDKKSGNWKLHEGYLDAGRITDRTDSGATALALLAFLGDGHTPVEGLHAKTVEKGIAYLKRVQDKNGDYHAYDFPGQLGRLTTYYAHSLATIAMCEAYAMTGDPSLKSSCERAVKFLLDSQHPQNGGWRYQPQVGESMGDLSVSGIALLALHTARIAKISVPIDNFERANLFLEDVSEQNGSRYKYYPKDPLETITPAMTAEGLLCRQWLGWPKDHPAQREAIAYLLSEENRPSWNAGRRNVYEWFFTAQVLHNVGGPQWNSWYQHTSELILKNQLPAGGPIGGSWHPNKPPGAPSEFAERVGRLYLTTMCLLVLETPIRHAAIYPEKDSKEKAP